jgi:hypothetical protein
VFIDETGASTKMARLHGRPPRGQRLRGAIPHGHWKTTTFVGALRLTGMTALMVLDGAMTGEWFLAYARQVLAPTLRPGDMVILDNLPAHKGTAVRHAIEATGARLLFLPPYSTDFNALLSLSKGPSRTPSPSSRRCCERPPPAPSTSSARLSASASTPSPPPNAPTTSPTAAMTQTDREML